MSVRLVKTHEFVQPQISQLAKQDIIDGAIVGACCGAVLGWIVAGTTGAMLGCFTGCAVSATAEAIEAILERKSLDALPPRKSIAGTRIRMCRNGRALFTEIFDSVSCHSQFYSIQSGKPTHYHKQRNSFLLNSTPKKRPRHITRNLEILSYKSLSHRY